MARSHTTILAAAAGALALVVGLAVWLFGGERAPSSADAPVGPGATPAAAPAAPDVGSGGGGEPRDTASPSGIPVYSPTETSVAWPVRVELELVRGAHIPKAKDLPAMGSGATARFAGRLLRGESGLRAKLTFGGGPNAGRELETNEKGEFGASDLYPGLNEVRVDGGGFESIREVRLRPNQETLLNVSYDLPGAISGSVFDREGNPLPEVDVELDGVHAQTDDKGAFVYNSAPGGDAVRLVLRKEGFASLCTQVAVAAGRRIDHDSAGLYRYTLYPAATLEVLLGPRVGARDDALVVIQPEVPNDPRSYPWHRISPAHVKPGTTLRIDDLPAMRISVRVYHEGAKAQPESQTVFLQSGQVEQHSVRFEPAPSLRGVVQDESGRKIEGARVVCEVPDRYGATLQYLGLREGEYEAGIVPTLPPAAGEVRTDFNGEFQLSTWPELGATRYLSAQSPDGKLWGGRAIAADAGTVTLVLKPLAEGQAVLRLDFGDRKQGLPVVLALNGQPREEVILPAGERLEVGGLATGTWRMRAFWNGRPLLSSAAGEEFELKRDATRSVPLPPGAIEGQDAQTLLRAGRPVPSWAPSGKVPASGL